MNWKAIKKNAKASWRTNGISCHRIAGASKIASAGDVSRIFPATTAYSPIHSRIFRTRAMRNRVQSENLRRIARSKRPNSVFVQNW
jgi:hypothetical protein